MKSDSIERRRAGALLPLGSLPEHPEPGALGAGARRFVDFLAQSGLGVWQMLPLGPTHHDDSPYHTLSAHAGNPKLIGLDRLEAWGWLKPRRPEAGESASEYRAARLKDAHRQFLRDAGKSDHEALEAFCRREAHWLQDYALYSSLRREFSERSWTEWPAPLRRREPEALATARLRHSAALSQACFEQYVFDRQWQELREYARQRAVLLFGDMPFFVAHDSVDVWSRRDLFRLDAEGQPDVVAGVPPDYFSKFGQRWGHPLYRWDHLQADGFRWWVERLNTELKRFDLLRVDHFRGFEACWEIPAADRTAEHGRWIKIPGAALLETWRRHFGSLPLVAEDLGIVGPEVAALRERFALPGMKVLQFAFEGDAANPHLPHRHEPGSVVYTGTHDNDTTVAWFEGLPAASQLRVVEYLGYPHEPMPWPLIRAALASVSRLAIIPMQDWLALGHGHRLNLPGSGAGNWSWSFRWEQLPPDLTERLGRMMSMYGREVKS